MARHALSSMGSDTQNPLGSKWEYFNQSDRVVGHNECHGIKNLSGKCIEKNPTMGM